jgi:NADPH2:quinone reductase
MTIVVRIKSLGGPESLHVEDVELPPPRAGQVRLRQTAVGLNLIDTYHRSGLYPLPSLPHDIGVEAAGVVESLGPGVQGVAVGDRVGYVGGPLGAYASARNVEAALLVPLPDKVGDEQAAAVLLKGMTVEYLVRRTFAVEPGMTVLWHAAAGGVGLLACQWLHQLGATVIGTVGNDEKAELAREHGCDHTIVYSREDFVARVRELTEGKGVQVVYDSVGKTTLARSLDCLAKRGMLVAFGNASGPAEPVDPLVLTRKGSLYLTRPTLFDYIGTRPELLDSAHTLFSLLVSGALRVPVRHRWSLCDASEAHRALEARLTAGCSVLLP